MKFSLHHSAEDSKARRGTLTTDHGTIETPIFMPVGTAGTVKAVHQRELKSDINAEIILGNTYHLYLRPGLEVISAAGGKQSALEGQAVEVDGKPIKNGAFTHSVLEYLKKTDETLTVNGLKNYVEKRVEEITNGKQHPTSRQETMEVDWDLR